MGAAPLENPNKPSLATFMANQISEKVIIGRVWAATTGAEQHPLRTTVFGFNGCGTIGNTKKTVIGNTHGEPNYRKIKLIGGWGGDDWG